MEETTVKRIDYLVLDYTVIEYQCESCGAKYIDTRDNFKHCPFCGRRIIEANEN